MSTKCHLNPLPGVVGSNAAVIPTYIFIILGLFPLEANHFSALLRFNHKKENPTWPSKEMADTVYISHGCNYYCVHDIFFHTLSLSSYAGHMIDGLNDVSTREISSSFE